MTLYMTPRSATDELIVELAQYLSPHPRVLDPGSGVGTLGEAVRREMPLAQVVGIEIDRSLVARSRVTPSSPVHCADFLELPPTGSVPDLVISNPPFELWTEFTERIFDRWMGPRTIVAVLGRLGMLASQKRNPWWESYKQDLALRILSQRPSFTGDGKTDGTEYAWYLWGMPNRGPRLAWYNSPEEAV